MNQASTELLPSPEDRLEAREPKRRPSEIIASESWFLAKVVGGVLSGLYVGFQVLGIGLVTQAQFEARMGKAEGQIRVLNYAVGIHSERTVSDTNERTSEVYQPGHPK